MSEMAERFPDTRCKVCKKQFTVMKRCTRCQAVFYCSRQCQVKHWNVHKSTCQTKEALSGSNTATELSKARTVYQRDDHSIFKDEKENDSETRSTSEISHPPLVDFTKVRKTAQVQDADFKQPEGKFYLNRSKFHTDVPEVDDQMPQSQITVKCHKEKHKLSVQNSWTGEDIFKYLSYSLKIPLNNLKIIHKGKVLNRDNISETIQDKAVFQVIGEQAESEAGLDQRDISVMMRQMGLDRNAAIKVLKNKGDLLDALLDQ